MIKKTALLLACICLAACPLGAQQKFQPELTVGGSFGTTFSRVTFAPKIQQSMLLGYTFGVTGRYETEKNVGLQVELNYVQHGWKEKFEDPAYRYSRTLNYLEIPFFTHIYFGSRRVKIFLNLGPKIGYYLNEKVENNLGSNIPEGTYPEAHEMKIGHKFDWGLCGGPGLEIRTGIGYFLLEGRYYYALGDLFRSRREDFFSKSSSQVISAKLTYLIPVLRK